MACFALILLPCFACLALFVAKVVVGYIRPEAPFTTVEALVKRIYQDADATKVRAFCYFLS